MNEHSTLREHGETMPDVEVRLEPQEIKTVMDALQAFSENHMVESWPEEDIEALDSAYQKLMDGEARSKWWE